MADRLTPEQRKRAMSRVRSKGTGIEVSVCKAVFARGLRYRKNVKGLPGTPDIVFAGPKVAVFVDGDFWHGWRFPAWRNKLNSYWVQKIESNRRRDRLNFARLRRRGWIVIRVWGHQVNSDIDAVADRIERAVLTRSKR